MNRPFRESLPLDERKRYRISVLVLSQDGGWVSEVSIRSDGQLKTYKRPDKTIYATQDDARLAGFQWAEDYLSTHQESAGRPNPEQAGPAPR